MEPEAGSPAETWSDPYRPPEALAAGHEERLGGTAESSPFFSISPLKLLVMSLATFQLYQFYWFYKHWRHVNGWEVHQVMPAARAFFSPLFAFSLFRRVEQLASFREVSVPTMNVGLLALGYFVASAAWRLPSPADWATLLSVLPLLVFQRRVNALHAALGFDSRRNARFTSWNVLGLVAGGLFWLLVVAGLLLPVE